MYCPRTKTALKKINVGKVPVYVSEACGGVLFENQTLKDFECPSDKRGKALANHLSRFHNEIADLKQRVSCPLCSDTIMLRRFYSPLHAVEIDECPGCGAIWLDNGELEKLQSLMLNEKVPTSYDVGNKCLYLSLLDIVVLGGGGRLSAAVGAL